MHVKECRRQVLMEEHILREALIAKLVAKYGTDNKKTRAAVSKVMKAGRCNVRNDLKNSESCCTNEARPQPSESRISETSKKLCLEPNKALENSLRRSSSDVEISKAIEKKPWLVIQAYLSLENDSLRSEETSKKKLQQKSIRCELARQVAEKQRLAEVDRIEKEKFNKQVKIETEQEIQRRREEAERISTNAVRQRIENEKIVAAHRQKREAEAAALATERQRENIRCAELEAEKRDAVKRHVESCNKQMRAINAERARANQERALNAAHEKAEHVRVMEAAAEQERRECERRIAEIESRTLRFKTIGKLWENKGAGRAQKLAQDAFEKRLLMEAQEKEKNDQIKELNEKNNRICERLKCHENNKILIQTKAEERQRQIKCDKILAYETRIAADKAAIEEQSVKDREKVHKKEYGILLKNQAKAHAERIIFEQADMTPHERAINSALLRKIETDPVISARIYEKLTGKPNHIQSDSELRKSTSPWI